MSDHAICPIIEEEDALEEEEEDGDSEESGECSPHEVSSGELLAGIARTKKRRRSTKQQRDDDDSETDLELEEEKTEYDMSGRTTYLAACRVLGVVPVSYFLRHMDDPELSLAHHGLGSSGMKALSYPLMNNTHILSLDLQDNWLEGEGGDYIADMLKENCYIIDLNLSDNKLGARGCGAICRTLQTNVTLKSLNLSGDWATSYINIIYALSPGNELDDSCDTTIADALYENSRLKVLTLSHNDFGQTKSSVLADAISENETVERVDLSWNNFRLTSCTHICNGIATNSRLRFVDLSMNGFGNEGAFGIAEILKQSGSVTYIDISHNRIGAPGAIIIGKALEANDLLKTLKIGHNPLSLDGIKTLYKGVAHEASTVKLLDLSGIEIDKAFRSMKEELQESRDITILHGPVLSDYIIVGKPKKKVSKLFNTPLDEITKDSIMVVIKTFCDAAGLTLYDTMLGYDKNKEKRVTWADFLAALTDLHVELTSSETEVLDSLLTEYKSDGKIDIRWVTLSQGQTTLIRAPDKYFEVSCRYQNQI